MPSLRTRPDNDPWWRCTLDQRPARIARPTASPWWLCMPETSPGDQLCEARLAKLARLRAAGVEPYPYRYDRTHLAAELQARYDALAGQEVAVAGRLVGALRNFGKLGFVHLQDQSGQVQLYCRL